MRDDQAGDLGGALAEQPLPELRLGLDVERARQIVEDEHLGRAREHPRRGGALDLAAGEADAARADDGVEPVGEAGQVAPMTARCSAWCSASSGWPSRTLSRRLSLKRRGTWGV